MNKPLTAGLLSTALLAGCSDEPSTAPENAMADTSATSISAPIAKKVPHEMTIHGHTRTDNYYWMRDDRRQDPEILDHLKAENAYLESVMAHTKPLQEKLYNELISRIDKDESSVPAKKNGYWYASEFSGDSEYPVYIRRKGSLNAEREVLLDINQLSAQHEYFSLGNYSVSTDNRILAYSADTLSRRIYDIAFKSLETNEKLTDKLTGTTGSIVWANDNKTVFYIKKDPQTLLGYQVYRHTLGTPQADDVLVYEEQNNELYIGIGKSRDGSIIYIAQDGTNEEAILLLDANNAQGEFSHFHPMEKGLKYSIQKSGEWYYVHTNWQAENYRLMKVHQAHTQDKSKWQEVIPHNPDVYLEDVTLFQDHLVISRKERGQTQLSIIDLATNATKPIEFDEQLYVAEIGVNPELESNLVRVNYTSLTTPETIYDIDLASGEKTLLKQQKVLGDFNPADYHSERIFITTHDGVEVPVSLVYKKSLFKKDGSNPLWQYAYGSYGSTIEPEFRSSRLSLLDRGFVYAIAHIRGGKMLGQDWYEQGRMFNKINTYTDFIDATKALVAQKYAAADKVFAQGGSAGGLLMGAVANMAPELYRGMHAAVPFVDVVTTMLDESIHTLTCAVKWGVINRNPVKGEVRKFSIKARKHKVSTKDLVAFASTLPRKWQLYISLKLLTRGRRKGELLAIKLCDLQDDGIHFVNNKDSDDYYIVEWSPEIRSVVEEILSIPPRRIGSAHLFVNKHGKPYLKEDGITSGFDSTWGRYMREAIKSGAVKERFTEHDLRKKAVEGESLQAIQRLLRHSSAAVSKKHYAIGDRIKTK